MPFYLDNLKIKYYIKRLKFFNGKKTNYLKIRYYIKRLNFYFFIFGYNYLKIKYYIRKSCL